MGVVNRLSRAWRLPTVQHVATAFTTFVLLAIASKYLSTSDANKCEALMTRGQWYHDNRWLTPGCATEPYSRGSLINNCFEQRRIVLAGDASLQGIYWMIVEALDADAVRKGLVAHDLNFSNKYLELEYLWDPFLNGSGLAANLNAYNLASNTAPALTVVRGGQWHVQQNAVAEFYQAMDNLASSLTSSSHSLRLRERPLSQKDGPGDLVLFMPVHEPFSSAPDTDPKLGIHQVLNDHLQKLAKDGHIDLLSSFAEMTRGRNDKYLEDETTVDDGVLRRRRDVVMGLRCNAKIAVERGFPYERTCCGTWRGPNWVQIGFLTFAVAILPLVVLRNYISPVFNDQRGNVVRAFSTFALVVSLDYLTDRTHIFEQVTRLPLEMNNLYSMLLAIAIIGLMSIRSSVSSAHTIPRKTRQNQPFLSRDQSDEWKGWMQALIITYHYNMAWTSLWFWEFIRLAVSSYLFLTGFGHTIFFLEKNDYSLKRVAAVMIRTNLLPVTLAYVMHTRWLLYYYMPLSSFWFLVVYATLAIAPSANASRPLLLGKIAISAALVRTFVNTPELPETVLRFFVLTCKISFDAQEFFDHRVRIDQYIVYIGMLAAMFYLWVKQAISSNTSDQQSAANYLRQWWPWLRRSAVVIAAVALPIFWYTVSTNFISGSDWTARQPYIAFVPILAFLVLRNAHPSLRGYHSVAFAWLGRYSGEMYVMQNHLWLAGDQETVLRTGLFHGDESLARDRWRDVVVLTPLYLIMCCIVGDATGELTKWFVQDVEASHPAAIISTDEVEMGLLAESEEADDGTGLKARRRAHENFWKQAKTRILPLTLRSRVLLLLGSLWVLNMVRHFYGYLDKQ